MLTGEKPEVNPEVAARLARVRARRLHRVRRLGVRARARARACCPHSNLGVLDRDELARLREVNASMGLMLESISERLMETVHAGSPTKHPARAAGDDRGRGRAQDPLHERHPGRDRRDRGRARRLARGARGRARAPRPPPGGDPPELRPAPALLRAGGRPRSPTEAARRRWEGGGERRRRSSRATTPLPEWATPVTLDEMKRLVARLPAADAGRRHPGPAQPLRLVARRSCGAAPPTSAACPRTATTSRPRSRSRARTRCASASRPRATR